MLASSCIATLRFLARGRPQNRDALVGTLLQPSTQTPLGNCTCASILVNVDEGVWAGADRFGMRVRNLKRRAATDSQLALIISVRTSS